MLKKRVLHLVMLVLFIMGSGVLTAYADGDTPPAPITVTNRFKQLITIGTGTDGVVSGPAGNLVTITNRYYPLWQGLVKTDGWASGNFNQPAASHYHCESKIFNGSGQASPTKTSDGTNGGTNCPTTPIAQMSTVVPATLTSYTSSTWKWSNNTSGNGTAQQNNYQP